MKIALIFPTGCQGSKKIVYTMFVAVCRRCHWKLYSVLLILFYLFILFSKIKLLHINWYCHSPTVTTHAQAYATKRTNSHTCINITHSQYPKEMHFPSPNKTLMLIHSLVIGNYTWYFEMGRWFHAFHFNHLNVSTYRHMVS